MLKTENALMIIIDFQEKLVNAVSANKETKTAVKSATAAKILNIPIIISEQYPKGLGKTVEELFYVVKEDAVFVEKTSFSLLKEDNILEKIQSYGKKQIILFGIETHICVLQTAIELKEKGFEVYVIKNACKSRQESEYLSGLDTMRDNGINIVTLEIALFELLETSKNPKFKEIQALIK